MSFSRNGLSYNDKSLRKLPLHKISLYQRYFLSQINSEKNQFPQPKKTSIKKMISLKKVFETHDNKKSPEKLWPKITKPKLPFSIRNTESNDFRKNKIKFQKPSKTLHNFYTVKWLRNKYSDSVLEKSVLSLLPEKSNEIEMVYEEDRERSKRYQKMMDYLKSLKGPVGREKFVEINPKYFFDESTFDKILKLREVFLEFDQKKTQKMDFYEILNMFNHNHIKADKKDIADLFFKGKRLKRKEDIAKLNLGFFQFVRFALKKEQNFKEFMRKIKEKTKKSDDKENLYLPMDFNLIMDYFINKEKERHSINKLKKAVNTLNNDIKINEHDEKLNFKAREKTESPKRTKRIKNKTGRTTKKEKRILSDINILELFNDFINLFHFISQSKINIGNDNNNYKNTEPNSKSQNKTNYNQSILRFYNTFYKNNSFKQKNKLSKTINRTSDDKDILNILIKNQMNKNSVNNMKLQNYNKYHDIDLAREVTLTQIKENSGIKDNFILEKIEKKKILKNINERNERNSKLFYNFSNK